jgi:hypothetical protein
MIVEVKRCANLNLRFIYYGLFSLLANSHAIVLLALLVKRRIQFYLVYPFLMVISMDSIKTEGTPFCKIIMVRTFVK